jgi:Na+-transporting methylmalonyl-CoA/oxaloacetate decarboxylase gamma subunit
MQDLDADIVTHDDDVKENLTTLQDLMDNIGGMDISEILSALSEMEGNLSAFDTILALDIGDIKDSVDIFQQDVEGRLAAINTTLDELEKLQTIIDDLADLDQALTQSKDELKADIDEIPTESKEEEGFGMAEGLLIVLLVLLIINLLVMLMSKGKTSEVKAEPEPRSEDLEEDEEWEELEEDIEDEEE